MSYTAIVDYGVGNLKSLTNAMNYLGLPSRITSDRAELERADAILLPGVGAFPDAAERLQAKYEGMGYTVKIQKPARGKDWNEYLQQRCIKERSLEIS